MGGSSIPKVFKIAGLKCFYVSKKKVLVTDRVHFLYADKHQRYHCHFWWKWPDMSKVPKVLLLWHKTFRCFTGVRSCSLLLLWIFIYFPTTLEDAFLMFVRGLVVSYIFYLQLKSSLYIENCNKEHTKEDFAKNILGWVGPLEQQLKLASGLTNQKPVNFKFF